MRAPPPAKRPSTVGTATLRAAVVIGVMGYAAAASPAPNTPAEQAAPATPATAATTIPDGPIDFRCDRMDVESKAHQTHCYDNVVLRRGPLLVCCKVFRGIADSSWQWQRFFCSSDVRALRGSEMMWANEAEFILASSDLILTGKPLLHRGKSQLTGTRIVVNVKSESAQVENPRARMAKQADDSSAVPGSAQTHSAPLPARCPLPPSPPR